MHKETVCKTIHQYNSMPVSQENMQKLSEIAEDCSKVKLYVYGRYSGIKSISKLYPGYTVQNEMIETELREKLGLPFVYFNLAVFDALADIKASWTKTKSTVGSLVSKHPDFTDDDKHYLRFLLKVNNAFDAILNYQEVKLNKSLQKRYKELLSVVDKEKLDKYLRRQVRKCHLKPQKSNVTGFTLTERAYRYADHGIYITMKEKRKRIFIPLTDNNQYSRQIFIRLFPETGDVELQIPVDVEVKHHDDYINEVGLAVGMHTMLVTDAGNIYGKLLEEKQRALSEYMREQNTRYSVSSKVGENIGRKKYLARKHRLTEQLHSYINMELNRFIKTEKPGIVYIPKLPKAGKMGKNKAINYSASVWQRGYIKNRLIQKCAEQSVQIVEVLGKDISNECCECGNICEKNRRTETIQNGLYICKVCGSILPDKENAARNAKKRGQRHGVRS